MNLNETQIQPDMFHVQALSAKFENIEIRSTMIWRLYFEWKDIMP